MQVQQIIKKQNKTKQNKKPRKVTFLRDDGLPSFHEIYA